jgi:hypothetical protein
MPNRRTWKEDKVKKIRELCDRVRSILLCFIPSQRGIEYLIDDIFFLLDDIVSIVMNVFSSITNWIEIFIDPFLFLVLFVITVMIFASLYTQFP